MSLRFKCIGTGSSGNCYILDHNGDMLLLDLGMAVSTVKKGIDYNIMGIKFGIAFHGHLDHSKAVDDFKKMGIKVFTPYLDDNSNQVIRINPFTVQLFQLPHNGVENRGAYIKVADRRIVYACDCEYVPLTFKTHNLTDIFIECNYQDKYLNVNAENLEHKTIGHMSLDTCLGFIEVNATDSLRNVIILHMGRETCDANECVAEIKKVVPDSVNVDYAQAGKTWEL